VAAKRRKTYSDSAVSYAAVGATQAADVLIFPPAGFQPSQQEFQLGSSLERFEAATAALMTWGAQRGSHLDVVEVNEAQSEGYSGLIFNEFGAPVPPTADALDQLFAPDGTPYLSAGTTVVVGNVWSPASTLSAYRVIYVIREERRVGFAWGTLDESPVVGEELFTVEWRPDDTVWAVVRTVTAIGEGRKLQILRPLIRLRQFLQLRQYARALSPNRQA
jgi:uncharacterized protein (UPF0548 family)